MEATFSKKGLLSGPLILEWMAFLPFNGWDKIKWHLTDPWGRIQVQPEGRNFLCKCFYSYALKRRFGTRLTFRKESGLFAALRRVMRLNENQPADMLESPRPRIRMNWPHSTVTPHHSKRYTPLPPHTHIRSEKASIPVSISQVLWPMNFHRLQGW